MIIDNLLAEIKDFVQRNDYLLNLGGILIGVALWDKVGWIISTATIFIFIFLLLLRNYAKNPRRLCYTQRSFCISIKGLEINGKKYENLILTQIAIWNSGSKQINGDKVDHNNPLKLKMVFPYEIIDLDILDNFAENRFTCINQISSEAKFEFSYLKPSEGASIQIIHTGKLNEENIKLLGEIKGSDIEFINYSQSRSNTPIYKVAFTSGLLASISSLIISIHLHAGLSLGLTLLKFMLFSFSANVTLILLLGELLIYGRTSRIPQEFKKFHNQLWEPKKIV